jgi:hypothetical protein
MSLRKAWPILTIIVSRVASYSHEELSSGFLSGAPGSIIEEPEGLPESTTAAGAKPHGIIQEPAHLAEAKVQVVHESKKHGEETPDHHHHKAEGGEHGHGEHEKHHHSEPHEAGAEHVEGAHGEHEEAHGEHEAPEPEAFSIACVLMGGVGALMIVFYLVNSSHPRVKLASWRVLNMTVSIFVAVLVYGTIKMLILEILEPGFKATIAITLTLFVLSYVGMHFALMKMMRGDKTRMQATSTVLAHITGFAAMYGFADCQEVELLKIEALDGAHIILLILAATASIGLLSFAMDKVMKGIVRRDGTEDEDEKEWIETCEETDDDVFCLAISFLMVMYIRFSIRGKVMPYEPGKVGNVTQTDALWLVAAGFCFIALVVGGTVVIMKNHDKIAGTEFRLRVATTVQHLNSMIMGWCFLFWAEWQLYVWGWESTVIGGCLVVAVFLTLTSFALVYVLSYIEELLEKNQQHAQQAKTARRALASLELALGLVVGFSWERAFDVGFEEIEHTLEHSSSHASGTVWVTLLSILLFVIVAPAWRLYILPKALGAEKKESGRD